MGRIPGGVAKTITVEETVVGDGASWEAVDISGTPDYDPNASYSSITVHGGGSYTFGVENTIATNGPGEGATWAVAMPTGWVDDGTKILRFRMTVETSAPDNVDWWCGIGICDRAGDVTNASARPLTVGIYRQTTSDFMMNQNRTGHTQVASSGGTTVVIGTWQPGGTMASGHQVGTISGQSDMGIEDSRSQEAASGAMRLIVSVGCNDNGNDGPHSGRVKLEVAVQDLPS